MTTQSHCSTMQMMWSAHQSEFNATVTGQNIDVETSASSTIVAGTTTRSLEHRRHQTNISTASAEAVYYSEHRAATYSAHVNASASQYNVSTNARSEVKQVDLVKEPPSSMTMIKPNSFALSLCPFGVYHTHQEARSDLAQALPFDVDLDEALEIPYDRDHFLRYLEILEGRGTVSIELNISFSNAYQRPPTTLLKLLWRTLEFKYLEQCYDAPGIFHIGYGWFVEELHHDEREWNVVLRYRSLEYVTGCVWQIVDGQRIRGFEVRGRSDVDVWLTMRETTDYDTTCASRVRGGGLLRVSHPASKKADDGRISDISTNVRRLDHLQAHHGRPRQPRMIENGHAQNVEYRGAMQVFDDRMNGADGDSLRTSQFRDGPASEQYQTSNEQEISNNSEQYRLSEISNALARASQDEPMLLGALERELNNLKATHEYDQRLHKRETIHEYHQRISDHVCDAFQAVNVPTDARDDESDSSTGLGYMATRQQSPHEYHFAADKQDSRARRSHRGERNDRHRSYVHTTDEQMQYTSACRERNQRIDGYEQPDGQYRHTEWSGDEDYGADEYDTYFHAVDEAADGEEQQSNRRSEQSWEDVDYEDIDAYESHEYDEQSSRLEWSDEFEQRAPLPGGLRLDQHGYSTEPEVGEEDEIQSTEEWQTEDDNEYEPSGEEWQSDCVESEQWHLDEREEDKQSGNELLYLEDGQRDNAEMYEVEQSDEEQLQEYADENYDEGKEVKRTERERPVDYPNEDPPYERGCNLPEYGIDDEDEYVNEEEWADQAADHSYEYERLDYREARAEERYGANEGEQWSYSRHAAMQTYVRESYEFRETG